jgi:hypothetical protein
LIVRFGASRPFADPDKAARKLIEIANDVEAVQDGRILIERVNAGSQRTTNPVAMGPSLILS